MRGGDISNELAPAVAFRFERVVRTEEGKLNRSVKAYMETLSRIDVNLYIITTGSDRKALSFAVKWGIPINKVIQADSLLEIPDLCNENQLLTYYDYDVNVLQNVRARSRGVEAKQWTTQEVS